jgi:hypothetical protein
MAVTMKNGLFWNVTSCGSYNNRRFGGTLRLHHQGDMNRLARNNVSSKYQPTHTEKVFLRSVRRLLVLTGAARRNIPEDGIL